MAQYTKNIVVFNSSCCIQRAVANGDVVVVDLGARVNDWVSDVTRTYVVGGTDNETVISSYMAVYDAQNLTFPVIEAGTPAWVPDDIAENVLEALSRE